MEQTTALVIVAIACYYATKACCYATKVTLTQCGTTGSMMWKNNAMVHVDVQRLSGVWAPMRPDPHYNQREREGGSGLYFSLVHRRHRQQQGHRHRHGGSAVAEWQMQWHNEGILFSVFRFKNSKRRTLIIQQRARPGPAQSDSKLS
jgi:hypothetical protein